MQSRYYDPIVKRFLNADTYESTGQGFIGCNMFAYCNNSPATNADDQGTRMYNVGMTDGPGRDPLNPMRSCKSGVDSNANERFVLDLSISCSPVARPGFKLGISFVLDPIGSQDELFLHAGVLTGLSPPGFGVSVGAGVAWDYDEYNSYHGWFFDYSGNIGAGADFCHGIGSTTGRNPKALLATFSTSPSVSIGVDYYFKPEDIFNISNGAFSDIDDILPAIVPIVKQ